MPCWLLAGMCRDVAFKRLAIVATPQELGSIRASRTRRAALVDSQVIPGASNHKSAVIHAQASLQLSTGNATRNRPAQPAVAGRAHARLLAALTSD